MPFILNAKTVLKFRFTPENVSHYLDAKFAEVSFPPANPLPQQAHLSLQY